MNTAAVEQMANYYWAMWGATRGVAAATSSGRSAGPPSHGDGEPSREEQAFARDAAGQLGGCVWPPRSYTCTFCQREFRSAQALGGHMNVHRRDRARLRQCASPSPDHQVQPQPTSPDQHLQPDLYRAVLLSDPKSCAGDHGPSYISTIIKESKNKVLVSMPAAAVREASQSGDDGDDEDETMEERRKRRRVDQTPAVGLPFFVRPPAPCEGDDGDAKVLKVIPSPSSSPVDRQEVDLELRLGTSHKVA